MHGVFYTVNRIGVNVRGECQSVCEHAFGAPGRQRRFPLRRDPKIARARPKGALRGDGMARLWTKHQPARALGNGEGWRARQGAMRIFPGEGDAAPDRLVRTGTSRPPP